MGRMHHLFFLTLCLIPFTIQGMTFNIRDLDTLATDKSVAYQINNQSLVTGILEDQGRKQDFLWSQEEGLTLLPVPMVVSYQPPIINNQGQIVGLFWCRTNYWMAKNTRSKHLYLIDADGSFKDIGTPPQWNIQSLEDWQTSPSWDKQELAIVSFNDQGQILIANAADLNRATQFAIWQQGTFIPIDSSTLDNVYAMNHQGVLLGRKWTKSVKGTVPMLVLYDPKQNTYQEVAKDVDLVHRHLNNCNQVILAQKTGAQNQITIKGFLWGADQGLIALEDFLPLAFNNCNQIVGFQISALQQGQEAPLLWDNGTFIDLNEAAGIQAPDSIWSEIKDLKAINDQGAIIGTGLFDGKKHAFILIPEK